MNTFTYLCEDTKSKKCFALKWIIWRITKDSTIALIVFSYRHDFILTEFDETVLLGSNSLLQGRFISSFYLEWLLIYYHVNHLNLTHATFFHGKNIIISNRSFEDDDDTVAEKVNILGVLQSTSRLCTALFNFMQTNIGPQDW